MEHHLTDERLAWLAVRDQIARKANRAGLLDRLRASLGRERFYLHDGRVFDTGNPVHERANAKMSAYALAVDDVAQLLNAEERRTLRATGRVPEWFLDRVDQRYAEICAQ